MSKKNKAKFKKRLKSQYFQEIIKTEKPSSDQYVINPVIQTVTAQRPEAIPPIPAKQSNENIQETQKSDEYIKSVKGDLLKTAIIIGSLLIVTIVTYVADNRTGFLLKFGTKIFNLF